MLLTKILCLLIFEIKMYAMYYLICIEGPTAVSSITYVLISFCRFPIEDNVLSLVNLCFEANVKFKIAKK